MDIAGGCGLYCIFVFGSVWIVMVAIYFCAQKNPVLFQQEYTDDCTCDRLLWRPGGTNICVTGGLFSLVSHNNPDITVSRTDFCGDRIG